MTSTKMCCSSVLMRILSSLERAICSEPHRAGPKRVSVDQRGPGRIDISLQGGQRIQHIVAEQLDVPMGPVQTQVKIEPVGRRVRLVRRTVAERFGVRLRERSG